MKKFGPGGVTPFAINTKPNIFTPLSNDELIERRGESALWFRLSPCPCPQSDRTPDCKFCLENEIRTFQEEILIQEEISWKISGNLIHVRYGPIKEIHEAILIYREKRIPLRVKRVYQDYFEIEESLEYYQTVEMKYTASLVEEKVFEVHGINEKVLFPAIEKKCIIGIQEIFRIKIEDGNEVPEIINWKSFNLKSIVLDERAIGLYRMKLKTVNPVKIGYKTFTIDKKNALSTSMIGFQDGDILGVMPSGYRMGEGDIIALLYSTLRHSHFVPYKNGDIDRLQYSPIAAIDSVVSKNDNGLIYHKLYEDFVIFGDSRIQWLTDKPRSGYTVIYDYHPTFRVTGFVEAGSGEDRPKPRQFKMKAVSSFNGRE